MAKKLSLIIKRPFLFRVSSSHPYGYFLACLIVFSAFVSGCGTKTANTSIDLDSGIIGWVTESMTDMMVHDITNPPLAARFYAYSCLAGYEVISQEDPSFASMHGALNDYPDIPKRSGYGYQHTQASAILAMIETASKLQPSGREHQALKEAFLDSCRVLGIPEMSLRDSEQYAISISQQILNYAQGDRYREISNYPRYTPKEASGFWYPTPPGYFAPVEPYFNTVRPFTLTEADQFKPEPPIAFSESKDSDFYRLMKEVYDVELNKETRAIAAFWDCNPFALEETGHLMVGLKQISPGGHWMGITDIVCRQAGVGFSKTMEITVSVAIGLMDGFLGCWDEKYRSNRIRPETAIRKYIDPSYIPLLQTPPFPEYLSGHSTISSSAAEILTHYFGDNFAYTDSVEVKYGLDPRDFSSFYHAAREASISRLYGGIHFMDAIEVGQKQGKKIGGWVIHRLSGNELAKPLSL